MDNLQLRFKIMKLSIGEAVQVEVIKCGNHTLEKK